jgi:hypothetical protein
MVFDSILVVIALGVLGLGVIYAFRGGFSSGRWGSWIAKAGAAAGAAFTTGMLLLGLPGAFFLEAVMGPGERLPPDSAWPLSIFVTQFAALAILPASLLLRVAMPRAAGWRHAGATALLTIAATLVFAVGMVDSYPKN